jgi:hypothetical protein
MSPLVILIYSNHPLTPCCCFSGQRHGQKVRRPQLPDQGQVGCIFLELLGNGRGGVVLMLPTGRGPEEFIKKPKV